MKQTSFSNRDEVFTELNRRGIVRVEVEFSGGGDEGGVDKITVYPSESELEPNYPQYDYQKRRYKTPMSLEQMLCWPVESQYGGFGFEGSVHGKVIWDVPSRSVRLEGEQTQYVPFTEPFSRDIPEEGR